jgi:hypothetical protein
MVCLFTGYSLSVLSNCYAIKIFFVFLTNPRAIAESEWVKAGKNVRIVTKLSSSSELQRSVVVKTSRCFRIFDKPDRMTSQNEEIRAANGSTFIRIDTHIEYAAGHVRW